MKTYVKLNVMEIRKMKRKLNIYFRSKALENRLEPAGYKYRIYSWLVRHTC